MAYSLAFAALDWQYQFPPLTRGLTFREREQLRISVDQLRSGNHRMASVSTQHQIGDVQHQQQRAMMHQQASQAPASRRPVVVDDRTGATQYDEPLPRTLEEALRPTSRRAIVVTETTRPFRVVDVNRAWEDLCGYTYVESRGRSLGSLLKGPETDPLTVTALISQLLRGEEATALVTNYTKEGRKFLNRLHVGPLYHQDDAIRPGGKEPRRAAYFVGVLSEVTSPSEMMMAAGH
jgi:PAS domain S-box-containing protein